VPVVGYRTDLLPAFYTRTSDIRLEQRLDSAQDIARLLKAKWDLGLKGGVVVANPIPEEYSYPQEEIDLAIQEAVKKAALQGIAGKETTPFLLSEIARSTKGKSLQANIALVLNNCRLAADIAVAYGKEA